MLDEIDPLISIDIRVLLKDLSSQLKPDGIMLICAMNRIEYRTLFLFFVLTVIDKQEVVPLKETHL